MKTDHLRRGLSFGRLVMGCLLAIGLALPAVGNAATSGQKPRNATAECKDGTYSFAKTKRGACSKHGGVVAWYGVSTKSTSEKVQNSTDQQWGRARANGATARCKDGTVTTVQTRQGACSGHGGVQDWMPKWDGATQVRPSDARTEATAQCNDGTYSYAKHHPGACSSHRGVRTWFR